MKTFIPLLFTLFFGVSVFAQTPQSFRYQAVARDNSGNVLANQKVSFQISILLGSVSGVTTYSETHSGLITNAFGLVELEIGKGTPVTGTFSAINWGSNIFFVKVEMDPAGGSAYLELSTSQLLSVPYALHAKTVETGDNWGAQVVLSDATLTGNGTSALNLKLAQQGATTGQVLKWNGASWLPSDDNAGTDLWQVSGSNIYRLTGRVGIGTATPTAYLHVKGTGAGGGSFLAEGLFKVKQDAPPVTGAGTRMMWYSDKAAFRVGEVAGTNWDKDSVGNHSVAMGYDTRAKGIASAAIGNQNRATGDYSLALGTASVASGVRSVAIGAGNTASGNWSTVLGSYSNASGLYSIALGYMNTAEGDYSMALGNNTTAYSRSETVVGSNNTTYTPASKTSWDPTDRLFVIGSGDDDTPRNAVTVLKNGNVGIGTTNPTALMHTSGSGYGEGNVLFTGTYKETNPGDPPASGEGTRMMWYPDKAAFRAGHVNYTYWDKDSIGDYSVAMGYQTKAKDYYSSALGCGSIASGYACTAMGEWTKAIGNGSTAIGSRTTASGILSTAMGSNTTAYSSFETVIGRYNTEYTPASDFKWITTDRLFVVGNGIDNQNRSNALTILKNGNMTVGGSLTTQGDLATTGKITSGGDVAVTGKITVKGGKGIIRSIDAVQRKQLTTTVTVNTTINGGATTSISFTFPESFTAAPVVYVGNATGGGFAEVFLSLANVTTTGGKLFIFNPKSGAQSPNFTVNIIALGAE